jgi:hypothetical protein
MIGRIKSSPSSGVKRLKGCYSALRMAQLECFSGAISGSSNCYTFRLEVGQEASLQCKILVQYMSSKAMANQIVEAA